MANLLLLTHRMPFPPDKGDKVRSFHLLQHLVARHRVFVGTFADDPADLAHVGALAALCAGVHVVPMDLKRAKLKSLLGLATGEPLSLRAWRDEGLRRWVRELAARERIDATVVYSAAVAPYADEVPGARLLVDFVDVDSAKWTAYAERHAWPLSGLYRREGRTLLAYERALAGRAARSFFTTEAEAALFVRAAPEAAGRVEAMGNGVDADYFAPAPALASPFRAGQRTLVFTGAMDYWPNIDAVSWFARELLPALRQGRPDLHFAIVGRAPTAAVQALAGEHVTVTGTVADVRPYLQHAAVVVAPLRLARGIQNKVLEAMAMGRAVVAAADCASVVKAEEGRELVSAGSAEDFIAAVGGLLDEPARAEAIGRAARQCVLRHYSWAAHLGAIDRHLEGLGAASAAAAPGVRHRLGAQQEQAA